MNIVATTPSSTPRAAAAPASDPTLTGTEGAWSWGPQSAWSWGPQSAWSW
ncbi:hypothetical protein V3N99_16520 [Dermatophilaceae bacterium Soc4.6]